MTQSVVLSTFHPVPVYVNIEQDVLTCPAMGKKKPNSSATPVVTFLRSPVFSCLHLMPSVY